VLEQDWYDFECKLALIEIDLTVAVPVVNSLTFVFTLIMSMFLGEKISARTSATSFGVCLTTLLGAVLGMLFVLAGVTICVVSK